MVMLNAKSFLYKFCLNSFNAEQVSRSFSVLLNSSIYYMRFFTNLHRNCKQNVKIEKIYLQI